LVFRREEQSNFAFETPIGDWAVREIAGHQQAPEEIRAARSSFRASTRNH